MSALSLASRGYLCSGVQVLVPTVDPPSLQVTEERPAITGARTARPGAPTITSAQQAQPVIRGAIESPPVQPSGAPSITKATEQAPSIRKVKKD